MKELYHSNRWTHYYPTEREFAEKMLQAIEGAKIWAQLAEARPTTKHTMDDLLPAA